MLNLLVFCAVEYFMKWLILLGLEKMERKYGSKKEIKQGQMYELVEAEYFKSKSKIKKTKKS